MLTCTTFHVAVGHPEDVWVGRLGMFVEGGLQRPKPLADIYLALPTHCALIPKDDKTMPAKQSDSFGNYLLLCCKVKTLAADKTRLRQCAA